MTTAVELQNVVKQYGNMQVIHGVNLTIEPGEFTVFVGPSGCGKSTLLRMIAGLETISDGDLLIDGQRMNAVAAADRGIAMVFQSYALYPHMSVYKNLAFGLETARLPRAEIVQRVQRAAEILQIEPLLNRKPKQLSGGQRQRVAIGRAIVREPKIFLFDEPLSNLDAELRVQMRVEIAKLQQRLGNTTIYVTHDQVEAMTMADKIVVLREGKVEQIGAPLDLYNHPRNLFVAGFIGSPKMNFLKLSGNQIETGADKSNGPMTLGIRPEHITIDKKAGTALGTLKVVLVESLGGQTVVYAATMTKQTVTVVLDGQVAVGDTMDAFFDPAKAHLFDSHGDVIADARLPQMIELV